MPAAPKQVRRIMTIDPVEAAKALVSPVITDFTDRFERLDRKTDERYAECRKGRHDLSGDVDLLGNKFFGMSERAAIIDHRMRLLDGGGEGGGGLLNKLELGQNDLKQITADLKSEIRSLRDNSSNNPALQDMQAWKNKWMGVAAALTIAATLLSLIVGIVAALWGVFSHLK